MTNDGDWTPTQRRMLEVLSDGLPHTKEELHACCGPSCPDATVWFKWKRGWAVL
ncbi:MAG: hypothetical protein R6W89_09425 [Candidatus Hydrogenedentota bacterium]